MTLTPKDQILLKQLDGLDLSLNTALKQLQDAQGISTDIRTTINTDVVPPPPVGPVADFTWAPAGDPRYPRKLLFHGVPAGMSTYAWVWGNGTSENHAFADTAKTYPTDGTYTVTLTVTDPTGKTDTLAKAVKVDFSTPIPPDPTPVPPPTGPETVAKPPAIFISTKRPTVTGKTLTVPVGGDFQAAINAAQPGDEIALAMGGRYVANFDIPQKTGPNGWVTVRPDVMSGLPPEGTRRGPTKGMPVFESPNNLGCFQTKAGAARYHFLGIEAQMPGAIANNGLIRLGQSETQLSDLPRQFVFEQVYVHGDPTASTFRRAFMFNGADLALIDSFIDDCHQNGSDSQAVAGWNGVGPFKIVNCYLAAASENVIFGGTDPSIAGLIPGDIEIRRNHMTKPLAWAGVHDVKNLFELKNAQRVLVEGNYMDNNWASAQSGSAINLKSVNQNQTAPWSCTRDVMFRLNIVRNAGSGFNLTGLDTGATTPMERVTIIDNLIDGLFPQAGVKAPNGYTLTGDGRGALVNSNPIDLSMIHNTIMEPWNSALTFGGPAGNPPVRLSFRDNIVGGGLYGVKGPGLNTVDTFKVFMSDGRFIGNVVIQPGNGAGYPVGNFFPATIGDVGFMSPTNRKLASTSKYKGKATDGRDPGADIDAVMAATSGVVIPLT